MTGDEKAGVAGSEGIFIKLGMEDEIEQRPENFTLNINLDEIMDSGIKGIRRACIFMGFGVNAAIDPDFQNYHLLTKSIYHLVPEEVSAEKLQEFKQHFYHWIVSNALRELVESYEIFLEEIFDAVNLMQKKIDRKAFDLNELQKEHIAFRKKRFPDKLKVLQDHHSLRIPFSSHILSVKRARNCMGHRKGIVSVQDTKEDKLTVSWQGFDAIFIDNVTGEEIPATERGKFIEPQPVRQNTCDLAIKKLTRHRDFPQGHLISFDPSELHEICLTFDFSIRDTALSVKEIFKSKIEGKSE